MDVIVMPQLGETVVEGTIVAWSKAVGDEVAVDDTLFEVSTEKVDTEVPSAVAGYLREVLVDEGDAVPIGTVVAVITATADEPYDLAPADVDAPVEPIEPMGPEAASGAAAASSAAPEPGRAESGRTSARRAAAAADRADDADGRDAGFLSPVVQRLLADHDLAAADVAGSGRGGRITRADVLAAAAQRDRSRPSAPVAAGSTAAPAPAPAGAPAPTGAPAALATPAPALGPDDEVVELSRARQATAEHMARSLATAAHALVAVQVDYVALDPVRRAAGLSYLPFVARAVIDALAEFPHLNASFDGDRLIVHRRVHLGIAVDVAKEALLVPVVHGADGLRLRALGDAVADLADRARRRRLAGPELEGGTITITNVGSYGTVVTAPIINQPQVAILSTDGIAMTPVAVRTDDQRPGTAAQWGIAVHPVGNLSLSFDHRAVDGAYAAAFLARVRDTLQTRDWGAEVTP